MISTLSCALRKPLNLSILILQSFDYSNFTNHCASFAVISFDFSHLIVERSKINEMSKIENSVLKGWEFIVDSVATEMMWKLIKCVKFAWNCAHKYYKFILLIMKFSCMRVAFEWWWWKFWMLSVHKILRSCC